MSKFEDELNALLERTKDIKAPINCATLGTNIDEYNRPSEDWLNDVEIFYNKYLTEHALGQRIKTLLFHRSLSAYKDVVSCLTSISKDHDFIDKMNGIGTVEVPAYKAKMIPEYDVFLSHANADKAEIVDELNNSLEMLGVKVFYDKKSLEWGDNWKKRILDGTKKAEFAIIVISENFFDREWTEKELGEFLNRQNRNGQKLILPIVHGITNEDLRSKYPMVADIQAIDSKDYTCDQIALLFARQLIQRLKAN
ncbi:toll/interleukin-1 receptor domain-containing protein [Butyrivibrio sp.]|uniref:toll/interleukin-1 receptor domain-containing protein n=1 Tax=Butyrivibrio sp. TaxID=28121 RepID=UPI0025BE191D|nr:toll/interleukin-1 receptor domain-containing protein [Butyrivibrio sp.]MBE5838372.1 toll/interleukin-1 receptor domain-containing protein [Butyrivibrio sp.]